MIGQLSPSDPRMHNAPSKARRSMVLLPDAVCSSGNSGRSGSLWAHQTLTANQSLRSGDRPIRKTVPSPSRCNHDGAVGDLSAGGTPGRGWPASPVGALRRWHWTGAVTAGRAGRYGYYDWGRARKPQGSSCRRVHRCAPRVAAGCRPECPSPGARGRPGGRGGHQTQPTAVLRAPWQHLRTAGCEEPPIYDPIAPDPDGLINQGRDNATSRGIQIRRDDEFDEAALLDLLRAVVANNRAGGWRKIQSSG